MKLTHLALIAIRGTRKTIVPRLSEALGVGEQVIYKYIRTESDELTKASAIKIIREETGLTDEQILEETVTA
jgi:hypothetical protein